MCIFVDVIFHYINLFVILFVDYVVAFKCLQWYTVSVGNTVEN